MSVACRETQIEPRFAGGQDSGISNSILVEIGARSRCARGAGKSRVVAPVERGGGQVSLGRKSFLRPIAGLMDGRRNRNQWPSPGLFLLFILHLNSVCAFP